MQSYIWLRILAYSHIIVLHIVSLCASCSPPIPNRLDLAPKRVYMDSRTDGFFADDSIALHFRIDLPFNLS